MAGPFDEEVKLVMEVTGTTRDRAIESLKRHPGVEAAVNWVLENSNNGAAAAGAMDDASQFPPLTPPPQGPRSALGLTSQTGALVPVAPGPQLQQENDEEVQKAIAASLQTQADESQKRSASVGAGRMLSREDEDISKALEASLLDHGRLADPMMLEPLDPSSRLRAPDAACGLKNIGNTCYFNSLLQTYFYLPDLARAVLAFAAPDPDVVMADAAAPAAPGPREAGSLKLVRSLQRLFGAMVLGNRKYGDPTEVMRAVLDDSGRPLEIGNQQDLSEFNAIFLSRLEEGFRHARGAGGENVVKRLFLGRMVEEVAAREADGSEYRARSEPEFHHIILDVAHGELYAALDEFVQAKIDAFKTERGHETSAEKEIWFEAFPPVLTFQLQRVQFNKERREPYKDNRPFAFDRTLYVDRYVAGNAERTRRARSLVENFRRERAEHAAHLAAITSYGAKKLPLHEALAATLEFLSADGAGGGPQPCPSAHAALVRQEVARQLEGVAGRVRELEGKVAALDEHIVRAYGDMREHPYELHAVLVHDGVAGSGHYWAYMRDPAAADSWLKFSDITVTRVDEATVWRESRGGSGLASAYCFIYVDPRRVATTAASRDYVGDVGGELRAALEAENEAFRAECERYAADKRAAAASDEAERFVSEQRRRVEGCVARAAAYAKPDGGRSWAHVAAGPAAPAAPPEEDPRLAGVEEYLALAGERDALEARVAAAAYRELFGAELRDEQQAGADRYRRIEEALEKKHGGVPGSFAGSLHSNVIANAEQAVREVRAAAGGWLAAAEALAGSGLEPPGDGKEHVRTGALLLAHALAREAAAGRAGRLSRRGELAADLRAALLVLSDDGLRLVAGPARPAPAIAGPGAAKALEGLAQGAWAAPERQREAAVRGLRLAREVAALARATLANNDPVADKIITDWTEQTERLDPNLAGPELQAEVDALLHDLHSFALAPPPLPRAPPEPAVATAGDVAARYTTLRRRMNGRYGAKMAQVRTLLGAWAGGAGGWGPWAWAEPGDEALRKLAAAAAEAEAAEAADPKRLKREAGPAEGGMELDPPAPPAAAHLHPRPAPYNPPLHAPANPHHAPALPGYGGHLEPGYGPR